MVRIENECVDCGLPCLDSCKYKNVPHLYCDKCGDECDTLYYSPINGKELCKECVLDDLEIVSSNTII
jgi:hypothetical protein